MSERAKLIAAFLVLWLGTTGALTYYGVRIEGNTAGIAREGHTLRVSQLRACHRLNIMRAEGNRSQLKDFEVFTATLGLVVKAAGGRPTVAGVGYEAQIKADIQGKEWTPLTQCGPAVDEPDSYIAPEPIAFSVRLPPPEALEVGKGE